MGVLAGAESRDGGLTGFRQAFYFRAKFDVGVVFVYIHCIKTHPVLAANVTCLKGEVFYQYLAKCM